MRTGVSLLLLVSLVSSQYVSSSINLQPLDNRVSVELYFESLCPYCKTFITSQLQNVLAVPNIWQIANFRVIPYGNADSKKSGMMYSFTCQHGESECQGNILMNCALNLADVQTKSLPFVLCLEKSSGNWDVDGLQCANANGLNFTQLKSCTNSIYGRNWQYQAGLETQVINVDHVPYVTINGVFDQSKQSQVLNSLLKVICTTYKGSIVLPACVSYGGPNLVSHTPMNTGNASLTQSITDLIAKLGYLNQPYPTTNYN